MYHLKCTIYLYMQYLLFMARRVRLSCEMKYERHYGNKPTPQVTKIRYCVLCEPKVV